MITGQPTATKPKTENRKPVSQAAARNRRPSARDKIDVLTPPHDVPAPLVAAMLEIGFLTDAQAQNPAVVKAALDICLNLFLRQCSKRRHRDTKSKRR